VAATVPARLAHATISAASVGTSSVTGSGNDADGSTTGSAAIVVNNGTQLNTRMEFNVNSDAGFLGSDDQSGTATHKITFNATAPGGYRLDISTSRVGDVNRINDDIFGCDGQAHISAVTGTTNIALNSGTLNITPAVDLNNGSSTAETPFSQTSGTAQIFRVSNGVAQAHTLTFTWTASTRSNDCEAASWISVCLKTYVACGGSPRWYRNSAATNWCSPWYKISSSHGATARSSA